MAWENVPTKVAAYDAMEYADNTNGTTASQKLIAAFTGGSFNLADIPVGQREDFEAGLDYRMGACANIARARAWKPQPGVWP